MTEVSSIGITLPLTILVLSTVVSTTLQLHSILNVLVEGENERIVRAAFPSNEEIDFLLMDRISGPTIYRFILANGTERIKVRVLDYSSMKLVDYSLRAKIEDNNTSTVTARDLLTTYSDKFFKAELVNTEDEKGRADYYILLTQEIPEDD